MNTLILMLACVLANLPFLRLTMVRRWHPAANDFAGWLAGYALWMTAASLLGGAAGRNWEVWAITAALFAVLAFPGIVWRHLR
ncbi:DUF2818 family protein [Duganella callida]|uniref:DUF2818 family protein n=1 Tax=Duganella callida TaxID=2561932 RepID=A0A4Y9SEP5_9BURK|nr:DUF2818 family protein [Duganella callida]TFW21431.1 DUF2818 family protein [Duganella callida]